MYLEVDQWYNGYEQILLEARPNNRHDGHRSVLLLCNADVDAMASARILSYLLRSDAIHYQLLPCTSYTDLKETLAKMKDNLENDDICAIILLNFGASRNLTKLYFDPETQQQLLPETVKIYVMDCRRPVHLANIHEDEAIVVFMNETKEMIDEFPSDGDDLSGNDEDSGSSVSEDDDSSTDEEDREEEKDSSDEDEEKEIEASFDDVKGSTSEKKLERDFDYDGEDEEDDQDDDGDDDKDATTAQRTFKRPKTGESRGDMRGGADVQIQPTGEHVASTIENRDDNGHDETPTAALSQRKLYKDRAQRLLRYYDQGSYFAAPCSYVAYHMAEQLRHGEQSDLLWLACVGVTDAYLHSRIDKNGFGEIGHALKNSCNKMFPDTRVDRAMKSFNAEHLDGRDNDSIGFDQNLTKIKFSDNGRIMAEDDYRLFLLRHTSFLDSMLYSEYVYSKLQMNTKKGQQRFMEMLAKMGLPLDECRQPFRFMKTSLRSRLKEEFENHADVSFGMKFDCAFFSFVRRTVYLLLFLPSFSIPIRTTT
jgi:cell division control protein 45